MTSTTITAARKIQRRQVHQSHYVGCPKCWRHLSIAEVIERHCEECGMDVRLEEIQQRRAA